MIQNFEGNLLDFPHGISVIAHSCNCQNKMGRGIALDIKTRYPKAYEADTLAHQQGLNQLGKFSYALVTAPPSPAHYVYNLYTQQFYGRSGRHVNYDAFYQALQLFHQDIKDLQETSNRKILVGLPYHISCKNAGGSWLIIGSIIYEVFDRGNSSVDLVIVKNSLYDV